MNEEELKAAIEREEKILDTYTESYEKCKREYQILGVVSDYIKSQIENIDAGNKLFAGVSEKLQPYEVSVFISAKDETENYIDQLNAIKKKLTTELEEIVQKQNILTERAKNQSTLANKVDYDLKLHMAQLTALKDEYY